MAVELGVADPWSHDLKSSHEEDCRELSCHQYGEDVEKSDGKDEKKLAGDVWLIKSVDFFFYFHVLFFWFGPFVFAHHVHSE